MNIAIDIDMTEILTRLDMIVIANETDASLITDRIEILEKILQAHITNNILFLNWVMALMGFIVALLVVVILAVSWR
jgi:hypothetical protein